jgi:hypothetical protein
MSATMTPVDWAKGFSGPPDFSSGQGKWSSALLRYWSGTSPDMDQPPLDHHYIAQHLGGPKSVERRKDGAPVSTTVELGGITVVPRRERLPGFLLARITDYIDAHLADPISLADLGALSVRPATTPGPRAGTPATKRSVRRGDRHGLRIQERWLFRQGLLAQRRTVAIALQGNGRPAAAVGHSLLLTRASVARSASPIQIAP